MATSTNKNTSAVIKPQASSYLNYGSYSGSDITVYVHIPKSLVVSRTLNREVLELEKRANELKTLEADSWNRYKKTNDQNDIRQAFAYQREYLALYEEIKEKESQKNTVDTIPTTIALGEIQTISWSTFREKTPVRPLGTVYPKGFVRGNRTIAGSMVFTIFNKHALHELLEKNYQFYSTGTSDYEKLQYSSVLPDQLPPLDISLIFANEYGAISYMGLYGVEFVQEGATFSIEDIFSENVVQYVARDMDPISVVAAMEHGGKGPEGEWSMSATKLMADKEDELGHLKRRNPFI